MPQVRPVLSASPLWVSLNWIHFFYGYWTGHPTFGCRTGETTASVRPAEVVANSLSPNTSVKAKPPPQGVEATICLTPELKALITLVRVLPGESIYCTVF